MFVLGLSIEPLVCLTSHFAAELLEKKGSVMSSLVQFGRATCFMQTNFEYTNDQQAALTFQGARICLSGRDQRRIIKEL